MTCTPSTEDEEGVEHLETGSSMFSSSWHVIFPTVHLRDSPKSALQLDHLNFPDPLYVFAGLPLFRVCPKHGDWWWLL